jgi:hypothetical protein
MSEWWTYRPSDFLMFAPDTYWRQFELHNAALWPLPLLVSAALVGLAAALLSRAPRHRIALLRFWLAAMALCTAFVGWGFLWQRYASINWAAAWFAMGFATLAAGLLAMACWPGLRPTPSRWRWHAAMALLVWTALLHPVLPLVAGWPLAQAQWVSAAPDPTVLATLGALLAVHAVTRVGRVLWRCLLGLGLAWCAISAATLWTMGSAQGWTLAALAAGAGLVAWRKA